MMVAEELPRTGYVYRRTSKALVGDFFHELEKEIFLRFSVQIFTRPELCVQIQWRSMGDFPEFFNEGNSTRTLAVQDLTGYLKSQRLLFQRLGWEMMTQETGYYVVKEKPNAPLRIDSHHTLSYKYLENILYLS